MSGVGCSQSSLDANQGDPSVARQLRRCEDGFFDRTGLPDTKGLPTPCGPVGRASELYRIGAQLMKRLAPLALSHLLQPPTCIASAGESTCRCCVITVGEALATGRPDIQQQSCAAAS